MTPISHYLFVTLCYSLCPTGFENLLGCVVIIIIIIIILLDLLASFLPKTINKLSVGDSDARGEWVDEQMDH